jgi:hypothetical protein
MEKRVGSVRINFQSIKLSGPFVIFCECGSYLRQQGLELGLELGLEQGLELGLEVQKTT